MSLFFVNILFLKQTTQVLSRTLNLIQNSVQVLKLDSVNITHYFIVQVKQEIFESHTEFFTIFLLQVQNYMWFFIILLYILALLLVNLSGYRNFGFHFSVGGYVVTSNVIICPWLEKNSLSVAYLSSHKYLSANYLKTKQIIWNLKISFWYSSKS